MEANYYSIQFASQSSNGYDYNPSHLLPPMSTFSMPAPNPLLNVTDPDDGLHMLTRLTDGGNLIYETNGHVGDEDDVDEVVGEGFHLTAAHFTDSLCEPGPSDYLDGEHNCDPSSISLFPIPFDPNAFLEQEGNQSSPSSSYLNYQNESHQLIQNASESHYINNSNNSQTNDSQRDGSQTSTGFSVRASIGTPFDLFSTINLTDPEPLTAESLIDTLLSDVTQPLQPQQAVPPPPTAYIEQSSSSRISSQESSLPHGTNYTQIHVNQSHPDPNQSEAFLVQQVLVPQSQYGHQSDSLTHQQSVPFIHQAEIPANQTIQLASVVIQPSHLVNQQKSIKQISGKEPVVKSHNLVADESRKGELSAIPTQDHIYHTKAAQPAAEASSTHISSPTGQSTTTIEILPVDGDKSLNGVREEDDVYDDENEDELSESNVNDDELRVSSEFIEQVTAFKCKLCSFLSLEVSGILKHVNSIHKSSAKDLINGIKQNGVKLNGEKSTLQSLKKPNTFVCSKCYKGFPSLQLCRHHMINEHKFKADKVWLEKVSNNNSNKDEPAKKMKLPNPNKEPVNGLKTPSKHQMTVNKATKKVRDILPNGKVDDILANGSMNGLSPKKKQMTNKKIAWRKKIKREQGAYMCEFKGCNVRFRIMDNLTYHHRCHSDLGTGFVCGESCGVKTESWSSMAGHLWRDHCTDMELHSCELCTYKTYSLSLLENIHKRIHSEEKNFLCDFCGKGFKNQKQLINHKARHATKPDDNKIHSCEICGRSFNEARPMRIHMNMVHNKLRPFICSHCGHSASSRSALRTHMRSHTGEKPFKCDLCTYSTSDHNSLRRHKMRHSGERPYKCPFCPYACIQSSTYKQHLRNKHPGQNEGLMFCCNICGFKTVNNDIYQTHISQHNGVIVKGENRSPSTTSSAQLRTYQNKTKSNGSVSGPTNSTTNGILSPTLRIAKVLGEVMSSQTN